MDSNTYQGLPKQQHIFPSWTHKLKIQHSQVFMASFRTSDELTAAQHPCWSPPPPYLCEGGPGHWAPPGWPSVRLCSESSASLSSPSARPARIPEREIERLKTKQKKERTMAHRRTFCIRAKSRQKNCVTENRTPVPDASGRQSETRIKAKDMSLPWWN